VILVDSEQKSMSFIDHLEELRWRIIKTISSVILGGIITFFFIDLILNLLLRPLENINTNNPINLQVLSVQGMFIIKWTIAFIGGLVISVPVITYQIWKFIAPGLYANEKGFVLPLVVFSFFSFCSGIFFSYEILIPYCLNFFAGLSGENILNNFSINHYFSFITWLLLGCGIVFQLPVISFLLSTIGVLTPAFMRHYRRHSVVAIFIVSSFITPPDPVSMVVMAFPLIILFELSIGVSWMVNKTKGFKKNT
jgi:sec-independent protein translocase protein TatC